MSEPVARPARPSVSVMIAAHQAEATIERAVRSALAQSGVDLEVLVVDDGSRDRTAGLVAALAERDDRIRLIRAPVNGGPARARNLALERACGHWIAVLDADDAFRAGRLRALLRIARASGASMVADNLRLVDPAGGIIGTAMASGDRALWTWVSAETFVRRNQFNGKGFRLGYLKPMVARGTLVEGGIRYREDLRIAEDYQLCLDVFLAGGTMALTPAPLYDYTQTPGSTSRALRQDDVERLQGANAAALRQTSDRALVEALRERSADLEATLAHMRFVEHLKARRPLRAVGALTRHPAALPVALRCGRGSVIKRLRRLVPPFATADRVPVD